MYIDITCAFKVYVCKHMRHVYVCIRVHMHIQKNVRTSKPVNSVCVYAWPFFCAFHSNRSFKGFEVYTFVWVCIFISYAYFDCIRDFKGLEMHTFAPYAEIHMECVCIHMYWYVYIYKCTRIYVHTHTYICTYEDTYKRTCYCNLYRNTFGICVHPHV